MPVHIVNDSTADALAALIEAVEQTGEDIVSVLPAGQGWAAVTKTKPKPGRPPKTPPKER